MVQAKEEQKVERRTNAWGIDLNYEDALGNWHDTPDEAVAAVIQVMGADPRDPGPPKDDSVYVVKAGESRRLPFDGTVTLENGEKRAVGRTLPPDLPTGYHQLVPERAGKPVRLIVSPGKCFLPRDLYTWGWAVQLYAARSRQSWGIGDFADLDRLASWSAKLGAGMMLVNPLSAATPILPQQSSPYYPTSRRFFNPLWLHIEWIDGTNAETVPQIDEIAKRGRALNSERLIDRDKIFELKMRALEGLWRGFKPTPQFDQFCREHQEDLDRFATFSALAEEHKSGWHTWPSELQHPESPAVSRFAKEHQDRILFHKWIQWLLDLQLSRSSKHLALMQDLPIGCDPDGADAWAWQDVIAHGVGVGAPPDEFNTQGQSWGLPPFIPHKLRAAGYEPFIQTIRAGFRHGGGLRIDHVMGLFRLFWIPSHMKPSQGAYVRYDQDEMLAIVALESQRAKGYVVGEDLGTVEEGVREKMAEHSVLSYRLLWFEEGEPEEYPKEALAAVTTHDLPTVAGMWSGSDLKTQQKLGLNPNEESTAEIRSKLKKGAHLREGSSITEVIEGAYKLLARAPSRIVTAALDDAAGVEQRPNMPATMSDQHPNWSIALPLPIEDLMAAELPNRIAASLRRKDPA